MISCGGKRKLSNIWKFISSFRYFDKKRQLHKFKKLWFLKEDRSYANVFPDIFLLKE